MAFGRKKKNNSGDSLRWLDGPTKDDPTWLAGATGVPNTHLPERNAPRSHRRVWKFAIRASIVVLPFSLFVTALLGIVVLNRSNAPVVADYASDSRPAAAKGLSDWLSGPVSPLPDARILGWEKVERVPINKKLINPNSSEQPLEVDVHTFSLASGTQLFTAEVSVGISSAGQGVIGEPILAPQPAANIDRSESELWPGFGTVSAPKPVETAVNTWVSAYMSGDPDLLRQVVGDADPSHNYAPINGTSVTATVITRTAPIITSINQPPDALGATAIANVKISYVWGPKPSEADATTNTPAMQMDVLIDGANTGAPKVVAWGASGTGPNLTPYSNAYSGAVVVVETPQPSAPTDPQPTGTQTPTPGASTPAKPTPTPTPTPTR